MSSIVFGSILVGINEPIAGRFTLKSSSDSVLKFIMTFLIGWLKKRYPANETVSPDCILVIGILVLKTSFVDKTVKGLPVSIKASTSLEILGVLKKKVTKGKGLLPTNPLIEQRILGNV